MTLKQFENLVKINQLKLEESDQGELEGLIKSGQARLKDSHNTDLSLESRFDLAYNAAHAISLAALRRHGYRSENRFIVFQCLEHTLQVRPEVWCVLAHCHNLRNRGEYEGFLDINERLVLDLIQAAEAVLSELSKTAKLT